MLDQQPEECHVKKGLLVFEGKWNACVLYELIKTPNRRFGELRKAIPPISNTMLTSTLKNLEHLGLIKRVQFNEIPPHVEYSLTESGRAIIPVFDAIEHWSKEYL